MATREVDIVDVHLNSVTNIVDAFSQYPLLDGDKKGYTVQVTEFVTPLAGQPPLPLNANLFEIRRKRLTADNVPPGNDNTRLTTLPAPLGGVGGKFQGSDVFFAHSAKRPMQSPGDLAYHLQRFFNDVRDKYVTEDPAATTAAYDAIQVQLAIIEDPNSSAAELAAAEAALLVAQGVYDALGPFDQQRHGSDSDQELTVSNQLQFVTVRIHPNGVLALYFHNFFTKHFWLDWSDYGHLLLGQLGTKNPNNIGAVTAYRTLANGTIAVGAFALQNDTNSVVEGDSVQTVEQRGVYALERHFDHRVRLEIESQMNTPVTVAWTTSGQQKMSNIIATFPISVRTQTSVLLNNEGVAENEVRYQSDCLVGDITFRTAEHKVSERYLLGNHKFFHNIRLEVFMVRKEWFQATQEFQFVKEKMAYTAGEFWSAKLRFRSV